MLNISVLVSGGGTNFQAIIDGVESGEIKNVRIAQVISSKGDAFALERGKKHGIKTRVIGKAEFSDFEDMTDEILKALESEGTDLIVLAGYMSILDSKIIRKYKDRIVNIHPSLIPKYSGKGFYGKRVHEAVLKAGEKESGATVHYVDEGIDTGDIILQKKVEVLADDTVDTLAERVLKVEHEIFKKGINEVVLKLSKEI